MYFTNIKSANLLLVGVQEVPQGLSQAWHWMHQQQQEGPWAPSDPACYISIAHALTAQGHPLEGEPVMHL